MCTVSCSFSAYKHSYNNQKLHKQWPQLPSSGHMKTFLQVKYWFWQIQETFAIANIFRWDFLWQKTFTELWNSDHVSSESIVLWLAAAQLVPIDSAACCSSCEAEKQQPFYHCHHCMIQLEIKMTHNCYQMTGQCHCLLQFQDEYIQCWSPFQLLVLMLLLTATVSNATRYLSVVSRQAFNVLA